MSVKPLDPRVVIMDTCLIPVGITVALVLATVSQASAALASKTGLEEAVHAAAMTALGTMACTATKVLSSTNFSTFPALSAFFLETTLDTVAILEICFSAGRKKMVTLATDLWSLKPLTFPAKAEGTNSIIVSIVETCLGLKLRITKPESAIKGHRS